MDALMDLVALRAIAGPSHFRTEQKYLLGLLDSLELGNAEVAEAWLSANPDGEFHCCVDGHSESNNTCSASLAIHIQQGYPTEPLQCHVCSDSLPRPWVDSSTVDLQARADQAATDSLPCLYELLQMLQDKLNDVPATMAQSSTSKDLVSTQSAAAPGPSSDAAPSAGCHACLLQLDHMRNKAAYIKTIKKWATQLGLTGRLIFLRQLIWIYLEGSKDGLREYITLQRTVSVDVDSKGRKCKERMMDVLCEEQVQQASYSDFRDVEVAGLDEAVDLVAAGGMNKHLRVSSGMAS